MDNKGFMIVQCPRCKKDVPWTQDSPFRPFCSQRCRVIDLGAWADGSYSIPSSETPTEEDLDEEDTKQNKNENNEEDN